MSTKGGERAVFDYYLGLINEEKKKPVPLSGIEALVVAVKITPEGYDAEKTFEIAKLIKSASELPRKRI